MKNDRFFRNQYGFTLVEIIAVLVMLAILSSMAVPRFIDLEAHVKQRAIDSAILELNSRESLTWANQKNSSAGYDDDKKIIEAVDYNLGAEYAWIVAPDKLGGTIDFKGISAALNRTQSTSGQPAIWRR